MVVLGTLHKVYSRNVEQLVLLTTGLYGCIQKQYLCMTFCLLILVWNAEEEKIRDWRGKMKTREWDVLIFSVQQTRI